MNQIRIKPYFSAIVHNPNWVELRQGVWNAVSHMLQDESEEGILAKVILGLMANSTVKEIAENINVSQSKVENVLDYLQQLGVLQSRAENIIDYYIDNLVPTLRRPGKMHYPITMPVVLVGDTFITQVIQQQLKLIAEIEMIEGHALWNMLADTSDEWLYDSLLQQKMIEQFSVWQGKFVVYATRHINPVLATKMNRVAYLLNIAWIHLALDGPFIFIGPTFQGKKAPCYDCFETRISMNLRESENYQKYKNALAKKQVYTQNTDGLLSITTNMLSAHAIFEIINYLTTQCTFTKEKTLSIFLPTMEFTYHEVLRFAACRTCGSVAHRDDAQLYFDFQSLTE
jgi:bacteriocin biosynthesis cyclodehydratase domain-containing protein